MKGTILYRKDKDERDKLLQDGLAKLQSAGLRLNPKTCQFHLSELSYLGHCISCNGLSPDDSHVKAVLKQTTHHPVAISSIVM